MVGGNVNLATVLITTSITTIPKHNGTSVHNTDVGCALEQLHTTNDKNEKGPRPPKHTGGGDSCLAFLDAHGVRVPACPLHAKANDVRPFLAVGVDFIYRKFLQHFTLRLQLV